MLEGYFFMPRNRVSVEELRVRVMKLKNDVNWESTPYQAEKDMAQKYLSYVLNILDANTDWRKLNSAVQETPRLVKDDIFKGADSG